MLHIDVPEQCSTLAIFLDELQKVLTEVLAAASLQSVAANLRRRGSLPAKRQFLALLRKLYELLLCVFGIFRKTEMS